MTAPAPPRPRLVRCPTCAGDSVYAAENPFRPFCSERCKSIDFGAWASEAYRMKATPPKDDAFGSDTPSADHSE